MSVNAHDQLSAGEFSRWIDTILGAIDGNGETDVPCDGCTACCRSAQFIHIGPNEVDTLAHVPSALRFSAPGMPAGHMVMGYDEQGCCPMLVDNRCSIYEHRPRTCRVYDCRVLPAAGLEVDKADKPLIAERSQRWRFGFSTRADEDQASAVQRAATYLDQHRSEFPDGAVPAAPTQLAVLAILMHDLFAQPDELAGSPDLDGVRVELRRRTEALGSQ